MGNGDRVWWVWIDLDSDMNAFIGAMKTRLEQVFYVWSCLARRPDPLTKDVRGKSTAFRSFCQAAISRDLLRVLRGLRV